MKVKQILGIMSGTSADGVDYALIEIKNSGKPSYKLRGLWSKKFQKNLRERILRAASNDLTSYEVAQLHHDLGRFYAANAPKVKCDAIGLHGQTIYHNPRKSAPATYQIGEPAYLSARFQVPVVNQFRTIDLALGGQGAPLATAFHREIFGERTRNVAVNNLGGISNVTFLGANKTKIISFDTGPANILVDLAIQKISKGRQVYDRNGGFASRGIPRPSLVEKWMRHPFFRARPPKSTGREEFGQNFFERAWSDCRKLRLSQEDSIATLALFTARSIADAYKSFLPVFPDKVILCGGGASNFALKKLITEQLRQEQWITAKGIIVKPVEVFTSDELGWPAQSIEAAAFAYLAYCTITGRTGNIPQTTGARRAARLGQISPVP